MEKLQIETEKLKHELYMIEMERDLLKKSRGTGEERSLSQVRQSHLYSSIKYCTEIKRYPVEPCCRILHVSRSAYYKWLRGDVGERVRQNRFISEKMEEIHRKDPAKGWAALDSATRNTLLLSLIHI